MSFVAAFGFIAGSRSPVANYDPHVFAIGVAALFGAACGAIGLLLARHALAARASCARSSSASRSSPTATGSSRKRRSAPTSFLEAQGDLIVRRDADGRITYANDAFCALAGRARARARRHAPSRCRVLEQGDTAHARRRHARCTTRRSPPPTGARWIAWREVTVRGDAPAPRCRASAATSPTASRPSARSPRRATRRKPPTAPSRASWRWSRTRSARRSTAFSAWPICCSTPR